MRLTSSILIVLAVFVPDVHSQFQWNGNWQYSNNGGTAAYTPSDFPGGGSLTGSGSHSFVQSGPSGGSSSATTTLTRSFTLTGSPGGWQISGFYDASGGVNALHGAGNASFTGKLDASTLFTRSASGGSGGGGFPFIWGGSINSAIIPDGSYSFQISHTLGGSTPGPPFSGPGSFGSGTITMYSFDVSATPVPEPQYFAFLTVALAGWFLRRR